MMPRLLMAAVAAVAAHPVTSAVAALAAVVAAWWAVKAARRAVRKVVRKAVRKAVRPKRAEGRAVSGEDAFTVAVAVLATALAVTGMYHFFGVRLHDSGAERVLFCGSLELFQVTEAVRARARVAKEESPGVDGAAMWVFAALSGVLSAQAAGSLGAAMFRMSAPLAAAWLWHRGLALKRKRQRGGGRVIHWRITPERVLVRLGLADPSGRTTGEVAAQHRLTVLARAAQRVRVLAATNGKAPVWRVRRAERHLAAAMTGAVEFAGLASDPARQEDLLAQLGALYRARSLAELDAPAPWDAAAPGEAAGLLAEITAELDEVRAARQALESAARAALEPPEPPAQPDPVPGIPPGWLAPGPPLPAAATLPVPMPRTESAPAPAAPVPAPVFIAPPPEAYPDAEAYLDAPAPGAPVSAPAGRAQPHLHPVPRTAPDADAPALTLTPDEPDDTWYADRAASLYAAGLADGELPSVRGIRTALGVGQPRAQRVRAILAARPGSAREVTQ
jgi:hypothetical protein